MDGILTKLFHRDNQVVNPFDILKIIIKGNSSDNATTDALYKWVVLDGELTKSIPKVAHLPYDVAPLSCEPVVQAIILWSKMKYHAMQNNPFSNRDTRQSIYKFIVEIERTLLHGARYHFINVQNKRDQFNLSFDEFCEFALYACSMR